MHVSIFNRVISVSKRENRPGVLAVGIWKNSIELHDVEARKILTLWLIELPERAYVNIILNLVFD
jgi:hypothetical protein